MCVGAEVLAAWKGSSNSPLVVDGDPAALRCPDHTGSHVQAALMYSGFY